MKPMDSTVCNHFRALALVILGGALGIGSAAAASYEWTFNNGDLSTGLGNGTMSYADSESSSLTTFGTTGAGIPNINGAVAAYVRAPAFLNLANGYLLTFNDTAPNGGAYVNNYTVIFDLLTPNPPAANWTSLFNTNPGNPSGNDGDFYIAPDYSVGIGGGGYSAVNAIAANTWHRLAFVSTADTLSFYVDGVLVKTRAGGGVDGRWALNSNLDAGADLLLFNEGDTSGVYTHELYLNSVAFIDRAMDANEMLGLGGPQAVGILVPEPGTTALAVLGLTAFGIARFRNKSARR